ncbi:MAG: hypothetical protein US53_C0051G0003 [Candidatus Woesebacteria bacterium GW2011_GWA1_37_7]|uniref:Uncharacterized protein n=1 Tax=Candidatus Woesebacteria bacterium GW2011_GWA1_37_7 TaxID=1618545 RepID=A0A0G0GZP1_9BACT|nr:MAG: hypothetical protein US53_C0051G0003 [Candidatus Woesebacteria bacterium GW2011_GWA1_37_7]
MEDGGNSDNQVNLNVEIKLQPIQEISPPAITEAASKTNKLKKLFIILVIVMSAVTFLLVILKIYVGRSIGKSSEENTSLRQKETVKFNLESYESSFWGYRFDYSPDLKIQDFGNGLVLTNYIPADKTANEKLSADEIKIDINTFFEDTRNLDYPNMKDAQKLRAINIGGVTSELYKFDYFSGGELLDSRLFSRIKQGKIYYQFWIEPADSLEIDKFYQIIESFKFSSPSEFQPSGKTVDPSRILYENLRYGFAFSYPKNWKFEDFNESSTILLSDGDGTHYFRIELIPKVSYFGGVFGITDIKLRLKKEISTYCLADGPGMSISCPEELTSIETFLNNEGVEGYRVKLVMVEEKYNPDSQIMEKTQKDVVAYVYELDNPQYPFLLFSPLPESTETGLQEVGAGTFTKLILKK